MKLNFLNRMRAALAAIPVMVALLAGASSAVAQTTSTTLPDPPKSEVTIRISGTVPVGNDSVVFDKQAIQIVSTLSRDADPAVPPQVILDISFLKFTGQAIASKVKYISDEQQHLIRLLRPADVLQLNFSVPEAKVDKAGKVKDGTALTAAESTQVLSEAPAGSATLNLTFDTNGVITGATGTVGANAFASAQ